MLKFGFLTITGCSFCNIFFPPRGGLGPKGCVGCTPMELSKNCYWGNIFLIFHTYYVVGGVSGPKVWKIPHFYFFKLTLPLVSYTY